MFHIFASIDRIHRAIELNNRQQIGTITPENRRALPHYPKPNRRRDRMMECNRVETPAVEPAAVANEPQVHTRKARDRRNKWGERSKDRRHLGWKCRCERCRDDRQRDLRRELERTDQQLREWAICESDPWIDFYFDDWWGYVEPTTTNDIGDYYMDPTEAEMRMIKEYDRSLDWCYEDDFDVQDVGCGRGKGLCKQLQDLDLVKLWEMNQMWKQLEEIKREQAEELEKLDEVDVPEPATEEVSEPPKPPSRKSRWRDSIRYMVAA